MRSCFCSAEAGPWKIGELRRKAKWLCDDGESSGYPRPIVSGSMNGLSLKFQEVHEGRCSMSDAKDTEHRSAHGVGGMILVSLN